MRREDAGLGGGGRGGGGGRAALLLRQRPLHLVLEAVDVLLGLLGLEDLGELLLQHHLLSQRRHSHRLDGGEGLVDAEAALNGEGRELRAQRVQRVRRLLLDPDPAEQLFGVTLQAEGEGLHVSHKLLAFHEPL